LHDNCSVICNEKQVTIINTLNPVSRVFL
jgi:hypothetical protein